MLMWNAIHCVTQGRSHFAEQIPCQDKTFIFDMDNTHVVALADGAGSAKQSHHGAACVTENVCKFLAQNFDSFFANPNGVEVKQRIVEFLLEKLDRLSKELNCKATDLASTLLLVALKDHRFLLAHIGDGVIGYLKNGNLKIASQPENGEYSNTTVFVTSNDALSVMKLIKGTTDGFNGFILMSDGTAESLYNKQSKSLASVLKKIMQLCLLLPTPNVQEQLQISFNDTISQATTDDCSIIVTVNNSSDFESFNNFNIEDQFALMNIKHYSKNAPKRLKRYIAILDFLQSEHSLINIARKIQLRPKYTKKHLDYLQRMGFVGFRHGKYHSLMKSNNKA